MAKISISIDDDLYQRLRAVAGSAGVSAWLAEAANARLRAEALHEVAAEIAEATGGPFTDQEIDEAGAWLR
jgi:post-segregation antitoxin (ccd killing protein)